MISNNELNFYEEQLKLYDINMDLEFIDNIESDYNNYLLLINDSNLSKICGSNELYDSYKCCIKGVDWKESTQRLKMNLLITLLKIQKDIINNNYHPKKVKEFIINERGRTRYIKPHDILDRVVQKAFIDNILLPSVEDLLIYDNGASLKGKGLSFSRDRFELHLKRAYNEFGPENTYILFIDFSKFFDNILHQEALNQFRPYISDSYYNFLIDVFKDFEIDVSYMDDADFELSDSILFNSLEYDENISDDMKTGEKMMRKSVGIGSQTSQITGIFYPHTIDNYCKIIKGLKYYGRYMDDTYIIYNDKQFLIDLLNNELLPLYNSLGIFVNMKKTCIKNINNNIITYLKINYKFRNDGKLIRTVPRESFDRELRRLNKFRKLFIDGRMVFIDILLCYLSWRGTYFIYDSKNKISFLDNKFRELFNYNGPMFIPDKYSNDKTVIELYQSIINKSPNELII